MVCMDAGDYSNWQYAEYRKLGVDAMIVSMDWDADPDGPEAAKGFFRQKAQSVGLPIYASDFSPWDGTALYPAGGFARLRPGMKGPAVGRDGFTLVPAPSGH